MHLFQPFLDVLQNIKQLFAGETCFYNGDSVYEPLSVFFSHRFGFIEAGAFHHLYLFDIFEKLHRLLDIAHPVAMVGAQAYVSQYPSSISSQLSCLAHFDDDPRFAQVTLGWL